MKSSFTIDGAIHNDTTWASDTVMVNGDIFVPDTVTLTINPGTVVLFNDWYTIDVQGQLLAIGAINDSIIFKPADTSGYATFAHTGWPGIKFDSTISADTSVISFCIFEFAKSTSYYDAAVYVNDFSNLIIEKSRFSYNYNISDNSDYSGTTTANLIVNAIYTMNGNMFRCIAGGQCTGMDVTSNPAIMIVNYNVGIENIEMPIAVYPNPATDFFYIQNASGAELTISDMNGRVVVSRNNISSEKEAISISTLNNGVYFIKTTSSNSTQIIRLIKE